MPRRPRAVCTWATCSAACAHGFRPAARAAASCCASRTWTIAVSRPELAAQLIDDLAWLGLEWDEGPYYQHDRLDLYEDALHQLQDAGLTYPCFCTRAELHTASAPHASDGTPIYRGACRGLSAEEVARRSALRAPATRLRVPAVDDLADDVVEFVDRTYGAQCEALATECGDFLVRRSDGVFAYQLAVVVDDAAMGVTEIVRGCDLLGSTPRQIYLQHLLGLPTPHYAHIPLLMSPDGRRLSKRDRDLDLGELRARFGTSEALLLARRANRHRAGHHAAHRRAIGRAL